MTGKTIKNDPPQELDSDTVSILQAIFDTSCEEENEPDAEPEGGFSKTASVKFMITLQDEKDLQNLGYSDAQIRKMKPQEARDILLSGTRPQPE